MEQRESKCFVMWAVQEWGQTEEARVKAVQDVLDAAGWKAKATCGPVFGGIWPRPCEGVEGEEASAWLERLTDLMPRGKFQNEVEHVERAIAESVKEREGISG